jgi:hypothetical protein
MKATNLKSRQSGFIGAGIALVMLAIAGGITVATENGTSESVAKESRAPIEIASNVTADYPDITE